MSEWIFYLISFLILAGALGVLLFRKIMHAAFSLLACLTAVAALYIFAGAEFVGATQLLIYAGGIMVLLIFGIMLSQIKGEEQQPFSRKLAAVLLSGGFSILLISLMYKIHWPYKMAFEPTPDHVKNLGFSFFTEHLLAFETAGILLLIALIGAMAIAGNSKKI